jgi:ATP synthase F1 delta subunit
MNKKTSKLAQRTAESINEKNVSAYALTCWKELQQSGGISKLDEFISKVRQEKANQSNEIPIKIISAKKLSENEYKQIVDEIKTNYDKKVVAESLVDPKILGGLVIKSEDQIIDLSWKGRLEQLKTKLVGAYE